MSTSSPHEAQPRDGTSLYKRVLRDGWFRLAAPVRCVHDTHDTRPVVRAHGQFRVEHGHHAVARMLARMLRLPPASVALDTWLTVTAVGTGERWERTFGTHRLETLQHEERAFRGGRQGEPGEAGGPGEAGEPVELVERIGGLELGFHLDAADGSLHYRQRGAALCWRSVRVRIPAWLAPRVEAREDPAGPRHVRARVQVTLPLIGLLILYEGIITVEETPA